MRGMSTAVRAGLWDSWAEEEMRAGLREMAAMLTSAQRLAGLGSWAWNVQEDRFTWSEETFRVLGLPIDGFDGSLEGFLAHVHPDDHAALREVVASAAPSAPQFRYRYRLRPPCGGERLIEGTGEAHFDEEGRALHMVGTVQDITQRERDRLALDDRERRFRRLTALTSDWYWQQDTELRFTEIAGGSHPVLERSQAIIGLRAWEIPGVTLLNTTWEEHLARLARREAFRDLQLWRRDGNVDFCVAISGEPFHDANGRFQGYRGTGTDITERKAAEQRLAELNSSLRMAMRLSRSGVWAIDAADASLTWWSGGRVLYALDGSPATTFDQLLDRVESEQRSGLATAVRRCLEHGESFDLEVHLVEGINPAMWARLIGEPSRDPEHRIRRVQGTVQDVTERRLAAERARELGSRLAATLDTASGAFVTVNCDWVITYLNQDAERLLQCPRTDLFGRNLWEQYPELCGTPFERQFRRALAEGETAEFDEYFEPRRMWLRVRACPSPQGLAIYLRDVTDSHSVQQALSDSQEQLRNLFENTIDGVLYTGGRDEIVRVNPAACAVLGCPPAQLRGRPFAALVQGGEAVLSDLWGQRSVSGRTSGQLTLLRADGSTVPVEVSSAEYTSADGSLRAFVVFRDISRRVRAEEALRQLNAELGERVQQRTAELEAANAELKAFAHSLAHDLRSPAAAIHGFSEMLEGVLPKPLPDRATHYLSRIRAAALKTTDYAQGLLGLAQVSQATLHPGRVDLGAMAADVLTQLAEQEPQRAVEWEVQEGLVATGDATLLRMLLENLLGNAWKFTRDSAPAHIVFTASCGVDGATVYRVQDNGAGFDMAYAHRLFGHFQRLHTQDEFPGTGVGLANVQRVAMRHGGRAWAESAPGEGATFYFTLAPAPREK